MTKQSKDKKIEDLFQHNRARNNTSRLLFALIISVFLLHTIYEFTQNPFLENRNYAVSIYLRLILAIISFAVFIGGYIVKRSQKYIENISFLFSLVFFITLNLSSVIRGTGWELNYGLIIIAVIVYASYLNTAKIIIFLIVSNGILAYSTLTNFNEPISLQFLTIFLLSSISFSIAKIFRIKNETTNLPLDRFFEEVFNAMRDSVFIINPETYTVVFNNKMANKVFGNIVDIKKHIIPAYKNTFDTALKMVFDFKGSWEGEVQFEDYRGIKFIAMASLSYFRVQALPMIFMKITDISKLKYAEKQLKDVLLDIQEKNKQLEESKSAIMNILEDVVAERAEATTREKKLEAVLQSISEGVVVLDANHRIYLFNDSALKMLGLSSNEILGKMFSEVIDFRDEVTDESRNALVEKAFQGESITSHIGSVLKRKDGKLIPVNESASPIFNEQKEVQRVVIVFRDATEQRKIDKMRSEFVSVVSHQLRTPLTSINWYVELLNDPDASQNLNDAQKESIQRIGEGNQRMINLVNDLLNVSRIETGRNFTLKPEKADIVSLVSEVIDEQRIIAEKKGMKIIFDNKGINELMLNIDKEKIRQVMMNLLSNAVKYSLPNTEVLLRFGKDEVFIYLDFIDSGIGIPEDQQGRVFEKFFRADNAVTQQTEGTGLGMYIGKSIARAHGGDITFYSKLSEGSTFTLKLPLSWEPKADSPTF